MNNFKSHLNSDREFDNDERYSRMKLKYRNNSYNKFDDDEKKKLKSHRKCGVSNVDKQKKSKPKPGTNTQNGFDEDERYKNIKSCKPHKNNDDFSINDDLYNSVNKAKCHESYNKNITKSYNNSNDELNGNCRHIRQISRYYENLT